MEKTVAILDADPVSRRALEKLLQKEGLDGQCTVLPPGRAVNGAQCITLAEGPAAAGGGKNGEYFTKPVRAGAVLEHIKRLLAKGEPGAELVHFGSYTLNSLNYELADHANSRTVRLTEKEGQILVLLAKSAGKIVTRKALLNSVWKYADGIETHTLETHIYRLRQKIEADPANPGILLTEETGYKLGKL